jgi:hypothetical protein
MHVYSSYICRELESRMRSCVCLLYIYIYIYIYIHTYIHTNMYVLFIYRWRCANSSRMPSACACLYRITLLLSSHIRRMNTALRFLFVPHHFTTVECLFVPHHFTTVESYSSYEYSTAFLNCVCCNLLVALQEYIYVFYVYTDTYSYKCVFILLHVSLYSYLCVLQPACSTVG